MRRMSRKAKRILIMGIIIGAVAGILITFLAANSKMHQKNDEMEAARTAYEKENEDLKAQLEEAQNAEKDDNIQSDEWNLLLINEEYPLDPAYTPELTAIDDTNSVDSRIAESVNKMLSDAEAAGLSMRVLSSYRSYDDQKTVFNDTMQTWLNQGYSYVDAYNETKKSVAVPGISEHAAGLALDIVSTQYEELDEAQADTDEQKWLMENCQNYGFILRYPENKTDITKIVYEPWHYRYVGEEAAKTIMEQGITLEEYLEQQ